MSREKDRELAYCESFSTSYSSDLSSRFRFDNAVEDADFSFNRFIGDVHAPAGFDKQRDEARFKDWDSGLPVYRVSRQKFDPADPSSQDRFFLRDVMAMEYEEIKKATENFCPDMLLGEGGFGTVYKGWLHEHYLTAAKPGSGTAVAVKKLNINESLLMNEIYYLSERHMNLVKLIGYSFDTYDKLLVYEFMPKGSLENQLFTRKHHSLPWITRMKVAVGAARALAFLHSLEIPVIFRDFKFSNILLDGDFNPKLSNFALAIDGPTNGMSHAETKVIGTYGYAAPEYVATGMLSTRCDVYGFGVVLIELISGIQVIDHNRPTGQTNLMEWVKPYLGNKKRLLRIMDKRLSSEYPLKEAYKFAKIGLQCANSDPKLRPKMHEVVAALETL